jgi:hypothetical protein
MLIIANAPGSCPVKSIVFKLGGFHTLMSFLEAIGNLMSGLGLTELLDLIYASNMTPHLLSG